MPIPGGHYGSPISHFDLLLLGVARGIGARSSILRGALETLGIATAAAITGYFIGKLVTL